MKKIKTVIFDMDGLMFDTERVSARFWSVAGEEIGLPVGEEFLVNARGKKKEAAEAEFYKCYGTSYDYWRLRNRKEELMREYLDTHDIPIKKGLKELLLYLKENDYKIVLATSTARHYAFQYLESAGVKHYFDGYLCGDMVSKGKPDPEIFLKAAELAGSQPGECVVLEDSTSGIHAAFNGGLIPVMVPDIAQPDGELEKKLAAKCGDLLEVIDYLKAQEQEN